MKERKGEDDSWESNAPKDLGGGFNKKSGTRKADSPKRAGYGEFLGKVSGGHKHIYGVDGENDPD